MAREPEYQQNRSDSDSIPVRPPFQFLGSDNQTADKDFRPKAQHDDEPEEEVTDPKG